MLHIYCYYNIKRIIISDFPTASVKKRYGYGCEILNSFKEKSSYDLYRDKLSRQHSNYSIEEWFKPPKPVVTEEARKKMRDAKMGGRQSEETKRKISMTMKGKSNFQGKKHSRETKLLIGNAQVGNQNVRGTYWAYNPDTSKEIRSKTRHFLPKGYILGKDYDSIEALIMGGLSTRFPKGRRSS
jgi:hypothetical protein